MQRCSDAGNLEFRLYGVFKENPAWLVSLIFLRKVPSEFRYVLKRIKVHVAL